MDEKIENHRFGRASPGTGSGVLCESHGPRGTPLGCREVVVCRLWTERCLLFPTSTQAFQTSATSAPGRSAGSAPGLGALRSALA